MHTNIHTHSHTLTYSLTYSLKYIQTYTHSWADLGDGGFIERQVLIANAAIMVKDLLISQQWDFLLVMHHVFIICALPVVLYTHLAGVGFVVTANLFLEMASGARALMLSWHGPLTVGLNWITTVFSSVHALLIVVMIQFVCNGHTDIPELEHGCVCVYVEKEGWKRG